MKFKINLKPNPGAHYFTVGDHINSFDPKVHHRAEEYLSQAEMLLRNLFKIPYEFEFNICKLSSKQRLIDQMEKMIAKDDPTSGIDNSIDIDTIENQCVLLDMSYSFPQVQLNKDIYDMILIDPNASLGIPMGFVIVFSKDKSLDFKHIFQFKKEEEFLRDVFLLQSVLADYAEKGIEVLLRESNYKAVLLNLMVGNSSYLKSVADRSNRSKTMIAAECDPSIFEKIEKMGFDVDAQQINNKLRITIANYPTQSKEMIEMFSDKVGAL